jgi:hypothetical protein
MAAEAVWKFWCFTQRGNMHRLVYTSPSPAYSHFMLWNYFGLCQSPVTNMLNILLSPTTILKSPRKFVLMLPPHLFWQSSWLQLQNEMNPSHLHGTRQLFSVADFSAKLPVQLSLRFDMNTARHGIGFSVPGLTGWFQFIGKRRYKQCGAEQRWVRAGHWYVMLQWACVCNGYWLQQLGFSEGEATA